MAETEESMTYIGLAPCGCLKFATVDNPERVKDVAREVAKAIRHGETVSRVTTASVRTRDWLCATHRAERESQRARDGA